MDILANAATGAATQSRSQSALDNLSNDYLSFVKLLTAQIQNQDPLEPIDSTAFVSQLAQLSQVEQTIASNTNLEEINARLAASAVMSDISLIGREVTLETDQLELSGGSARFDYEVADPAGLVTARIKAEDGTVVREFTGLAGTAGDVHSVFWDGLDDDGLPVPDSLFTIEVEAETTDGDPVESRTYASSVVEEVVFEDGAPQLVLRNGGKARSGQIASIR